MIKRAHAALKLAGWMAALLLTGCLDDTAVMMLEPDPAATGEEGLRGPHGVALQACRTQGHVSDPIRFDVTYPALSGGALDDTGAPYPAVMQIHGGAVEPERYQWLATHTASRGYVVIAPHHSLNLAIFESDNGSLALDDVLRRADDDGDTLAGAIDSDGPMAATGHSLGGVVASMRWVADDRIGALAMFAGYPPAGTDVESMAGHPSLMLTGSVDQVEPAVFAEEYERFGEPRWFGVIDGMNHYDWTDDATEGELADDGTSTRPAEESRVDALRVFDTWLDAHLFGDSDAEARLAAGGFPGVSEEP